LYPEVADAAWRDALAPREFWAALWPVLIGGALAVALWHWQKLVPQVPEGDVLVAEKGGARALRSLGATMEAIDWQLRQWPVAGVMFLVITVILAGAMLVGR
jgi:hypothetical protein